MNSQRIFSSQKAVGIQNILYILKNNQKICRLFNPMSITLIQQVGRAWTKPLDENDLAGTYQYNAWYNGIFRYQCCTLLLLKSNFYIPENRLVLNGISTIKSKELKFNSSIKIKIQI